MLFRENGKYPVKPVWKAVATLTGSDYLKLRFGTAGFPRWEQELTDIY
jgi:hypothetical protein